MEVYGKLNNRGGRVGGSSGRARTNVVTAGLFLTDSEVTDRWVYLWGKGRDGRSNGGSNRGSPGIDECTLVRHARCL